MQIKGKIPLLIIAALAWVVIISSCASQGMPTGGPRDSIPPVLVETSPEYKALNYKGDNISLTFDEYIVPEGVSELLVISPPLEKRPIIRTKGKSLVIQFNEELKDSTTYSLDFKNSISDNNEKNPYVNMRFSFSTGDVYDSLRVAGRVMNAFNLEPIESGLVLLQENLHDSAVYTVRPNYIAKTDETGLFMIDNIAPGTYDIFSLNDANNDLLYNEGAEEIAFLDTLIVPSVDYHEELDTLAKGVDSLMIVGHTHFSPDPLYLRHFTEDIFEQYLDSYKRDSRYQCSFFFNESVEDTFDVRLIGNDATDWYIMEPNEKMDSLVLWIADTTVARFDTLFMELSYYQLDSAAQLYVQKDTIEMNFSDKVVEKTKKKKRTRKEDEEEDGPEPIPQFDWVANIKGSNFDLNGTIKLIVPEPISFFDSTKVSLFLSEDTLKTPLSFSFEKDTAKWRSYSINYKWEAETSYTLEIDSAACENIYGITSKKLSRKFKTREADYYGKVLLELTNVKCPMVVQLLKNNDEEAVIAQRVADKDQTVIFDYVGPEKYKVKVIYDENGNGKWDSGSYQDKYQPEKVAYVNEVVKVRSNWEETVSWDLKVDLTYRKNIRDIELEEKLRKEAEKKALEERENPQRQEMQNSMMQGGGRSGSGGGGSGVIRR
ncbi:MAG: Ig-like domain-containing protein [Bacteroidetes bacterium]|nr:Ig-like domain-containing protein [Bacteroidota bacterium]